MLRRGSGILASIAFAVISLAPSNAQVARPVKSDIGDIFTCGSDQSIPPITVNWPAMVLVGDGRIYVPCPDSAHTTNHREYREQSALNLGHTSFNPEVRWRAAQALARLGNLASVVKGITAAPAAGPWTYYYGVLVDSSFGSLYEKPLPPQFVPACLGDAQYFGSSDHLRRWQPGPWFQFLIDDNPEIRKEAAYAIGTRMSAEGLEGDLVTAAVRELHACWLKQSDPAVQGVMLETLGVIRYASDEQRQEAEAFLVAESKGPVAKLLGAVRGLEAMIRLSDEPHPSDSTRARLRQLMLYGPRTSDSQMLTLEALVRRFALMALMTANDTSLDVFTAAASDDDWQMRRLVASRLDLQDSAQAGIAEKLAVDPAFQVRYDFLMSVTRWTTATKLCGPLVDRFKDPSPVVRMRAMDLVSPSCTDIDDATDALIVWADMLKKSSEQSRWHEASHALGALARISPDDARPRLAIAAKYPIWQVRAAAATAAVSLGDERVPIALMEDAEPNVRNAALEALMRLKSPAAVPHAIAILHRAEDYQLLRTAALALHDLPEASKDDAAAALLSALRRLTDQATDTSRDPRVAIVERLAEVLPAERSSDLLPYVADYDDEVGSTASKVFDALVGVPPAPPAKRRRYPYQPTTDQLSHLPTEARIEFESGVVTLHLLLDVAPVTVARFAELAGQHFYDDRTFHRIVPNFVAQGGSPAANNYTGTTRFMRDEVGPQASHVRGAVAMSSRGVDTGDGQIFVDLVDLPSLDRDYTVFAYVVGGMDLIDQLLEGDRILSIRVK
jgi:cyclophilin family peptidyl-prolyl cis-trans isomerase/HEAT repeat protein